MSLRLVIFDVDGTLVDSQADILGAMRGAFSAIGRDAPTREAVLSIVGLSLPQAMARLLPDGGTEDHAQLVNAYKEAFARNRQGQSRAETAPLYPGARAVIETLHAEPDILLAIATGKSRRGLDALIEAHELQPYFISRQVADDHPSKPHPSMVLTALSDAGVGPEDAVMVGDTTYDMEMARAAGVPFIGVPWGYHPVQSFTSARHILGRFEDLPGLLRADWGLGA